LAIEEGKVTGEGENIVFPVNPLARWVVSRGREIKTVEGYL